MFQPEPIPTMPALHLVSCTAGRALPPMEGVMLLPENVSERSILCAYEYHTHTIQQSIEGGR
eukprot:COSAG06_NODE_854_length_11931_cov_55.985970_9_plen_62_part_00